MESGDVAVSHDDKLMDNTLVLDNDNGDDTVSDGFMNLAVYLFKKL